MATVATKRRQESVHRWNRRGRQLSPHWLASTNKRGRNSSTAIFVVLKHATLPPHRPESRVFVSIDNNMRPPFEIGTRATLIRRKQLTIC